MPSAHDFLQQIWQSPAGAGEYLATLRETAGKYIEQPGDDDGFSRLPPLLCSALGGREEHTLPLSVAWQLLRYAARLLDDIEDGATDCDASLLNTATGLIFSASRSLNNLEKVGVSSEVAAALRDDFYGTLLQIAAGQHMDLTLRCPSLEESWQIASDKSAAFTGLICWASARLATSDPQQLALCRRFGSNLGLLDQIRDDLADLWGTTTAAGDLQRSHNWGLPTAYALSVLPHDQRRQLLQMLDRGAAAHHNQARELIIQSGAAVYLMVQSTILYNEAAEIVAKLALNQQARDHLLAILSCLQPAIRDAKHSSL